MFHGPHPLCTAPRARRIAVYSGKHGSIKMEQNLGCFKNYSCTARLKSYFTCNSCWLTCSPCSYPTLVWIAMVLPENVFETDAAYCWNARARVRRCSIKLSSSGIPEEDAVRNIISKSFITSPLRFLWRSFKERDMTLWKTWILVFIFESQNVRVHAHLQLMLTQVSKHTSW